jgi:hypothetical protein
VSMLHTFPKYQCQQPQGIENICAFSKLWLFLIILVNRVFPYILLLLLSFQRKSSAISPFTHQFWESQNWGLPSHAWCPSYTHIDRKFSFEKPPCLKPRSSFWKFHQGQCHYNGNAAAIRNHETSPSNSQEQRNEGFSQAHRMDERTMCVI